LQEFWRAVDDRSSQVALASFEKLLGLARGQGFDAELLPFVEAARVWSRKVHTASLRPPLAPPLTFGPRPRKKRRDAVRGGALPPARR
jgi:hypothetical protein